MTVKAPGPDELLPSATLDDPVLAAYYRVMRLKRLFRQGWLKRDIQQAACETVAEHSFAVAMLALLAPAPEPETGSEISATFDRPRALLLALICIAYPEHTQKNRLGMDKKIVRSTHGNRGEK